MKKWNTITKTDKTVSKECGECGRIEHRSKERVPFVLDRMCGPTEKWTDWEPIDSDQPSCFSCHPEWNKTFDKEQRESLQYRQMWGTK